MNTQSTLRERISDKLRDAIISGEIAPGTRLQEVEIAEQYKTSRTPVREAFRQLESEGFLLIRPRRGAVVSSITARDIREFYEVKSVLESFAAKRAVARISDEDIERMAELNQQMKELYQSSKISKMVPVHNEFHEVFVKAAGNERLASLISSLVRQFQRFRIALSHTEAIEESIRVHEQIIEAFRERNEDKVSELVSQNSHQGGELLINNIATS